MALLAAALIAGCGGSETKTVTQVSAAPQPGQTPTRTTPTATVPKISVPTQTTPSAPPPGTLAQARAKVSDEGYNVNSASDYDPSRTLRVLVGTRKDSGDGYAKRAFF